MAKITWQEKYTRDVIDICDLTMRERCAHDKRLAYPDRAPIGSHELPLSAIRKRMANRPSEDYRQNRPHLRAFWYDESELAMWHADACAELVAYRARYHANLKYKHGKGELISTFWIPTDSGGQSASVIYNYSADTRLDQWSIHNTINLIHHIERIARRQGLTL